VQRGEMKQGLLKLLQMGDSAVQTRAPPPVKLNVTAQDVLRALFNELDKDRSGTIEMRELHILGQTLKEHWSADNTAKLMRLLGGSEDAVVTFERFCTFFSGLAGASFDALDRDRSGVLESNEANEVARSFGVDYQTMMRAIDKDGDGRLLRDEYVCFLLGYCLTGVQRGEMKQGLLKLLQMGDKATRRVKEEKPESSGTQGRAETKDDNSAPLRHGNELIPHQEPSLMS